MARAAILDAAMEPRPTVDDPDRPSGRSRDPEVLLASARAGDRGAIGRLLSLVERGGEVAREVGRLAFAGSGDAEQVVGITGAPGAGKSTLTDHLISSAKRDGDRVGVLAVDPSSPFSGGAILGDRIRMQDHALEEDVFIRSMATRGHQGGLALAAPGAIRVLVASGLSVVLVETVGVGQVEVEIAGEADTTLVVLNPGWGDAVQASKAGLLEVADIFAVNKADRPGAAETKGDLESMLDMNPSMGEWRPPVLLTTATTGDGVDALWSAVSHHRQYLASSGELVKRRERRLVDELQRVLTWRIQQDVRAIRGGDHFDQVVAEVISRRLDPYQAADRLLGGRG
jgi:LAO/AO transport system kinase